MKKLGIAVAEFNSDITLKMLEVAKAHTVSLGAEVTKIVKVPGAFDLPFAVKKLLELPEIDAVVTLGCVIENETEHDEIVAHNAARKIMDLSLEYHKPIGFGVSGPGMTKSQAEARIESYAKKSVEAALKLLEI